MKEYHISPFEYDLIKNRHGKYIVEGNGTFYWENGKRHRLDGPARECYNEKVYYFINGKEFYLKEEFDAAVYLYKNKLESYF